MEEVKILLEDLDEESISSVLNKWREVNAVQKSLGGLEDMLKDKIRVYLKERKWDRYVDKETNISVTLTQQKRQTIDKVQLKLMLTDGQLAQVTQVQTSERLSIVTPETRERLKKYAKIKKSV